MTNWLLTFWPPNKPRKGHAYKLPECSRDLYKKSFVPTCLFRHSLVNIFCFKDQSINQLACCDIKRATAVAGLFCQQSSRFVNRSISAPSVRVSTRCWWWRARCTDACTSVSASRKTSVSSAVQRTCSSSLTHSVPADENVRCESSTKTSATPNLATTTSRRTYRSTIDALKVRLSEAVRDCSFLIEICVKHEVDDGALTRLSSYLS